MKHLLLSFMFLCHTKFFKSRKKTHSFFEISTRFTFNVNFTFDPDDDETFLEASAVLTTQIGYMFGDRFSASIHAGYDYHPIHAIRAFLLIRSLDTIFGVILKTHFYTVW